MTHAETFARAQPVRALHRSLAPLFTSSTHLEASNSGQQCLSLGYRGCASAIIYWQTARPPLLIDHRATSSRRSLPQASTLSSSFIDSDPASKSHCISTSITWFPQSVFRINDEHLCRPSRSPVTRSKRQVWRWMADPSSIGSLSKSIQAVDSCAIFHHLIVFGSFVPVE